MNAVDNRPADACNSARERGFEEVILYPGDTYEAGRPYDSTVPLARYDTLYRSVEELPYDTPPEVTLASIRQAFEAMTGHLHQKYPHLILSLLRPIVVRISDLGKTISFSIPARRMVE